MIIALIGNDGSGKTTIAKELLRILRALGFEVIYKHEYQYSVLKLFFSIIGTKKIEYERKKMIVENCKSWKYYLWPFLVWIDVSLSCICFKLFKKKSIVIMDRYLFDHFLSFKYLGYLTKFSEWLFLHSIKPDALVCVWVEPQIAFLRKKNTHDYGLDFYVQQTSEYLTFSKRLGIKAINTNKSLKSTVDEIVKALPKSIQTSIWKRGLQNKVLFSVAEKYELSLPQKLNNNFLNYSIKLKKTLEFLDDIFKKNNIKHSIVKTMHQQLWIGHDVDILVSPNNHNRLIDIFKKIKITHVTFKRTNFDNGKTNIKLFDGLPIDLHSYIGWGNVVFIPFEDILNKDRIMTKVGSLNFANEKINSIIFILTHIFEKGFITLNEYKFLKTYFDEALIQTDFSDLEILLRDYISWMKTAFAEKQIRFYPLFIPMHVILKSYSKLLLYSKKESNEMVWRLRALIRDMSFMIFWRFRYYITNRLPFEIDMNVT